MKHLKTVKIQELVLLIGRVRIQEKEDRQVRSGIRGYLNPERVCGIDWRRLRHGFLEIELVPRLTSGSMWKTPG